MPAKANTTKSADIQTAAREIDFVTRFAKNWDHLRDIMGISRRVEKQPGTILKSKYATVVLQSGAVGEGEEIPYSKAEVQTKDYAPIVVEKWSKGVTIEAIQEHGYDDAINLTDREFLAELQQNVTGRFYDYIKTGTLVSSESSFQSALAMAQGNVRNKWKAMHRGITDVVGFCNILDAYAYLGAANITVQSEFGMNYIENFIGYRKLFLCSDEEIPQGTVIATPVENMVLYYVNPANSDFARAGLPYTSDGETNLIGFHVEGSYKTAVSESYALMGLTLFAEYLDGIAVVLFGGAGISLDTEALNVAAGATAKIGYAVQPTSASITWASDDTDVATVSSGTVTGVAAGTATISASITVDGKTYSDSAVVTVAGA